ncbi:MAG: hypothetical protein SGI87_14595 [Flavobacteriales bacterium]|nr:hypothetical protein [Flavobacteriales bacterium]
MYHELSALALAQADLFSSRGILVRGSITIGQLYHENNEIFGPALIRAHKIEQTACYPRIVIDRELFRRYFTSRDLVNYQHLTHSIDYKYIRPIIRREANGDRIVDYLLYVINNFDYPEEIPDFLLKHKDFIKVGLANKSESIRKKFLWLSNYHNQSIERISDLTERNSFRI